MNKAIGPQKTGRTWHFPKGSTIYIHNYEDNESTIYINYNSFTPYGKTEKEITVPETDWDNGAVFIHYSSNENGYGLYLKCDDGHLTGSYNNPLKKYITTTSINPIIIIAITAIIITVIGFICYKYKH